MARASRAGGRALAFRVVHRSLPLLKPTWSPARLALQSRSFGRVPGGEARRSEASGLDPRSAGAPLGGLSNESATGSLGSGALSNQVGSHRRGIGGAPIRSGGVSHGSTCLDFGERRAFGRERGFPGGDPGLKNR